MLSLFAGAYFRLVRRVDKKGMQETPENQLVDIVKDFGAQVTVNIAIFIFFWILGFATGFSLVKFLIRRDIARRSLFKLVLANVLNSLALSAGTSSVCKTFKAASALLLTKASALSSITIKAITLGIQHNHIFDTSFDTRRYICAFGSLPDTRI